MTTEKISPNNRVDSQNSSELDLIQRIEENRENNARDKKSGYTPTVSEWDPSCSQEDGLEEDTRHVGAEMRLEQPSLPNTQEEPRSIENTAKDQHSDPHLSLSLLTANVSEKSVLNLSLTAGSLPTEKVATVPLMKTVQADETLGSLEKPLLQLQEAFANLALDARTPSDDLPANLFTTNTASSEPATTPPIPGAPTDGYHKYPPIPKLPKPWEEMTMDEKCKFVKDCLAWIDSAIATTNNNINMYGPRQHRNPRDPVLYEKFLNYKNSLSEAKMVYQRLLGALENPPVDPFKGFDFNWARWSAKIPKIEPGKAPTLGDSSRMAEALAEILCQLAQILGIAGKGRSDSQKVLTENSATQSTMLVKIASDTVERVIKKLEDAEKASSFSRIFGIIASVFMTIGAIASGQFQIAALSITLLALSETGKLQEGITALAEKLSESGVLSKDTAKLLSTLIFIVGTAIATGGKGAVLSTMATVAITSQYTGLITAVTPFLKDLSEEEKIAIQAIFQVILGLIAVIGSSGGGVSSIIAPVKLAKVASLVGRMANIAGPVAQVGQSSAQIGKGAIELEMADIQESLSQTQAFIDFFKALSQALTSQFKGDDKHMGEEINSILVGINELLQSRKEADATLAGILGRAEIRA